MVADTKKVQSAINRLAEILVIMDDAEDIKTKFVLADPDVTGTPLQGNKALVKQLMIDIEILAQSPIAIGIKAAAVSTHSGDAL